MADQLIWIQCEYQTAFVSITPRKTYRVKWLPDSHAWIYDGRAFEHVDMAKGAAQFEYDEFRRSVSTPPATH